MIRYCQTHNLKNGVLSSHSVGKIHHNQVSTYLVFLVSGNLVLIDHENLVLEVRGLHQPRVTYRGRLKNTIECAELIDQGQNKTVICQSVYNNGHRLTLLWISISFWVLVHNKTCWCTFFHCFQTFFYKQHSQRSLIGRDENVSKIDVDSVDGRRRASTVDQDVDRSKTSV